MSKRQGERAARVTRIEAGHYRSAHGEVRNVYSQSGAPHARNARAKWLLTPTNGRPYFVSTLARAREVLAAPISGSETNATRYTFTRATLGFWVCLDYMRTAWHGGPASWLVADDGFGNLRPCPCPVYAIECETAQIFSQKH